MLTGADSLEEIAAHPEVQVVVAGIVGAAGLRSALAAVNASKRLLLANKEPLVMAGSIFRESLKASSAQLLPLDSEHNAIFQCLPNPQADTLLHAQVEALGVRKITLTASGGPFLGFTASQLTAVTPAQACAHPTWSMGPKISVDSATLMNKGFEWIEACWLFGLKSDQLDVLIHPQSLVHALVYYQDGSMLAHMSQASMQVPIAHALAWPERITSGVAPLDLAAVARLDFATPDESRFPCLRLARNAFELGGYVPTVLNAANEVGVAAFLNGQLSFDRLPGFIESVLDGFALGRVSAEQCGSGQQALDSIIDVDQGARRYAMSLLNKDPLWSFSSIPSPS